MKEKVEGRQSNEVSANRLLGRGSRIFGLASVAIAKGQRAGRGPWNVLSDEIVGPAEEILRALEERQDPVLLEAAVQAALSNTPATTPPEWTSPLRDDEEIVDQVGVALGDSEVERYLGDATRISHSRLRGLAVIALAFCRTRDTLEVLSDSFAEDEKRVLLRMGSLANAVVEPGESSSMRKRLEKFLKSGDEA